MAFLTQDNFANILDPNLFCNETITDFASGNNYDINDPCPAYDEIVRQILESPTDGLRLQYYQKINLDLRLELEYVIESS